MIITKQTLATLRWQRVLFYVVFIAIVGICGFLSQQYSVEFDWSKGKRNTLSEASIKLLATLNKPVQVDVFATEDEAVRTPVQDLIERYTRHYHEFNVRYINPDLEPQLVRDNAITVNGEMIIQYNGRAESLKKATEESLTNTLQRLARSSERWLVFLSGHGERSPAKEANHDLLNWSKKLEQKGFTSRSINLAETPQIPDNTAVLVIASPQIPLLEGETQLIRDYVNNGGQLLWLVEPGSLMGLEPLAEDLALEFLDGIIVDPTTTVFGINDPRFAIVTSYPRHAIVEQFELVTLYPQARGIQIANNTPWQTTPLLTSLARSWSETGEMSGNIEFNEGSDHPGPLIVGLAMNREIKRGDEASKTKQQRVVVIGDGDFLSNAYLGNGGNLDLGLKMINWLSHDDEFIAIPDKTAQDIQLQLSNAQQIIIAFGFLIVLPIILLSCGAYIRWQRRKL